MSYPWDPRKAVSNLEKHGASYADVVGVLEDGLALIIKAPTNTLLGVA
ncbi:MAG: hypothetical protein GQ526_08065 [Ardenticatenales bacterium]|nr:hypothetical protein [Ardenticatenales bacterium]